MASGQLDDLQLQGDLACANAEIRSQLKVAGVVINPSALLPSGWTLDALGPFGFPVVRPTDDTTQVVVGAAAPVSAAKLEVHGEANIGYNALGSPVVNVDSFGNVSIDTSKTAATPTQAGIGSLFTYISAVLAGPLMLSGSTNPTTPLAAGNNNNIAPNGGGTALVCCIGYDTVAAGAIITGFDATYWDAFLGGNRDGAIIFLVNNTATPFDLAHESAASAVGNRIRCPGGAAFTCRAWSSNLLRYSNLDGQFWRVCAP